MVNYTKFVVKGTITIFIISILAVFLGYLVRLLLARNLTVEYFGLFYAVFAFLSLISFFKSFGLDTSLIKFIPEFKHTKNNNAIKSSIIFVIIVQLLTNLVIIAFIYLFSNYLSANFFHNPRASAILRLMAIAFFFDSFVVTLKFSFQGFQKMAYFAGVDFVRMLLLVVIVYIGLKMNYGMSGAVFAYIIVPVILLIIFTSILLKKVFPESKESAFIFDMNIFKKLFSYGVYVLAGAIGWLILGYTDSIVLTYFSGLEAVGLYNVALPTANVLVYIPRAFVGVLLPLTSELWVKKKKALLSAGMESLYKYLIIITLPFALIMFSFSDLIINVLYGKAYIPASIALKILTIGMFMGTFHAINSTFFSGIGKPQINSKIVYIAAIFNLLGDLILIPIMGIMGAAITTTASLFILALMTMVKIRKFIKITFPIQIWVRTAAIGIVFVFVIWFLKKIIFLDVWLETSIVLIISSIVYVVLLFLLKVININELKDLYRRIVK